MSNTVSSWSPLELVLPEIPAGTDYAFYFVTEPGTFKGLNLTFKEGDWLVYIKKNGIDNWYKTSGIVAFNTTASVNSPDPGFYTKVRLDNQGNVIAGSYIEAEDLPPHTHYLSDVTDTENIAELIRDVVGEMITNHDDSSVKLEFDSKTKTISAEVNYDGITIQQNEFGELEAIGSNGSGGSGSATSKPSKITINDVVDLSAKLGALEDALVANTIIANEDSGLDAQYLPGGTVVKVNVDGTSIRVNAYGQLEINPDFIVDSNGEISSSGGCATHEHTADQITDLKDFVVNIINQYNTINVTDIPIDNSTIVINSNGQLSAISAGAGTHKHVMDDITDLNKAKADTWASDQPIQGSIKVDYSKGIVDLTNFTIGYSIEKISEIIADMSSRIEYTESMVGKVVPVEPAFANSGYLTVEYIDAKEVYRVDDDSRTIAGRDAIITSSPIYPYNKGVVEVYIDDVKKDSIPLASYMKIGTTSGRIKVVDIPDSYPDAASFQGFYKSIVLSYDLPENLKEGLHVVTFKHVIDDNEYIMRPANVNIYNEITPRLNFVNLNNLTSNAYVSGVKVYHGDGKITGTINVTRAYNSIYWPKNNVYYTLHGQKHFVELTAIADGFAEGTFEFNVLPEDADKNIVFEVLNFNNASVDAIPVHVPNIIFDTTDDYEKYRCIQIRPDLSQKPSVLEGFEMYDPEKPIPKTELLIRDNIAKVDITNYEPSRLGPNYNDQSDSEGYRWINFVFKSKFRNNVYVDLLTGDNATFEKNKNGTLKDVQLLIGQGNRLVPSVWANGNKPFDGCSSAAGVDYAGLDLFRSDNTRRYVTFGQRPSLEHGYIFLKVGIKENVTLNCKALVNSILESINE